VKRVGRVSDPDGDEPTNTSARAHSRANTELVSHWLIYEKQNTSIEVLTLRTESEQKALPVFSSEEEAKIFLRSEGMTNRWQVRESSADELVSLLYGPYAGVKKVALDPSPEMVIEGSVDLVSLLRERFVSLVMVRRRRPLRLREQEERGSLDRCAPG
jgi:hypothetical protein